MLLSDLAKRTLAAVSARTVDSDGLWGGGVMDPVVLAATSASIVEALSTDAWQQVRDRMVELFRRARPQEADDVSVEFEEARDLILSARGDAQSQIEYELTVTFQRRLQDLAREASSIDQNVLHLLNDLLASSQSTALPHALSVAAARNAPGNISGRQIHMPMVLRPQAPVAEDPSGASAAYLPTHTVFDRLGPARMLPRDVPVFIGRDEEVRQLLEAAATDDEPSVCLVHGMPGVGKTALAVHVAHRLSESFPDGQLFINLRAHDPADEPASPYQILGSLLTAAGFPVRVQPKSVHGRAGLWRSWLSSKRMMIILDDAADLSQVEPLLPGYPGCPTVVTSRVRLESAEVTKSIAVTELAPESSAELFDRLLRHRGSFSDDDSASKVARLCGNLPLAVVVAASSLLAHPTWQVRHLIRELSDSSQRLVRLAGGHASISEALNRSVRSLDDPERRFLRRLVLHPGPALEKHAAAVLADTTVEDADRRLDSLYRHSLLSEVSPGRFSMHVLVSSYCHAAPLEEFADTDGPDGAGREEEVRGRLFNYYWRTATAAYLLETQQQSADAVVASLPEHAPVLRNASQAAQWLAQELDNLAACTQYSADHPEAVVDLTAVVISHLLQRGDEGVQAAHVLVETGERRAVSRGDVRAEAVFAHLSGLLSIAENDLDDAEEALQRAARMSLDAEWVLGAARAFYGLYLALRLRRRFNNARGALDEAAELFARAGDQPGLNKAIAEGAARPPSLPEQLKAGWEPSSSATVAAPGNVLAQLEELIMHMQAQHGQQNPATPGVGSGSGLPAPDPQSSGPETQHDGGGRGSGGGSHTPPGPGCSDDDDWPDSEDESESEDLAPGVLAAHELDAVDDQHINFWFTDGAADDAPLRVGESRTGCFQVGPDHPDNLAEGERIIPHEEIPDARLDTRWIVSSSTCELTLPESAYPHAREGITIGGDEPQWNIEFSLLIPPHGTSDERFVVITPKKTGTARIDAVVMVDGDPYRELTIEFPVDESAPGPQDGPDDGLSGQAGSDPVPADQPVDLPGQRPQAPDALPSDAPPLAGSAARSLCAPRVRPRHRGSVQIRARQRVPARETALRPPHAWQRPTHTLSLYVNPPSVWCPPPCGLDCAEPTSPAGP
ncbi:ATP-binding protein [Streptomyces sp. NPDC048192]|uniref:ATP-binding protein n=1 Tax=Streptomyces sp. NPDC048192 TaxID=3365510 RepID=UPI00371B42B8